ncbi:MAG: TPR repeat protein [Ascidiaceihabitans sp.]|jgi:TPR repeat protein
MDLLFKAANTRYPYALEYVGNMLYNGEVAGGNPTSALTYLKAASEEKQANSSYLLYKTYRDGDGIQADGIEANY